VICHLCRPCRATTSDHAVRGLLLLPRAELEKARTNAGLTLTDSRTFRLRYGPSRASHGLQEDADTGSERPPLGAGAHGGATVDDGGYDHNGRAGELVVLKKNLRDGPGARRSRAILRRRKTSIWTAFRPGKSPADSPMGANGRN